MNIRLIAGKYGGRVLEGSGTDRTHPMSERVRNSMFSIIGSEIEGAESCATGFKSSSVGIKEMTSTCPANSLPCPVNNPAFKPKTEQV